MRMRGENTTVVTFPIDFASFQKLKFRPVVSTLDRPTVVRRGCHVLAKTAGKEEDVAILFG